VIKLKVIFAGHGVRTTHCRDGTVIKIGPTRMKDPDLGAKLYVFSNRHLNKLFLVLLKELPLYGNPTFSFRFRQR
jgi:hypothetical protein